MFGHIDYSQHADRDMNESDTSSSEEVDSDSTQDATKPKTRPNHRKAKFRHPRALRMYTIKTVEQCELVTLSFLDLQNMKVEFPEVYQDLFRHQKQKLKMLLKTKDYAIKLLNQKQSGRLGSRKGHK